MDSCLLNLSFRESLCLNHPSFIRNPFWLSLVFCRISRNMKSFVLITIAFLSVIDCFAQEASFRVMSFNIRLPVQSDGINYWDLRRPLVASTIRYHEPDILGVQEAFRRQLDEMTTDMPEYAWFGVCRTDGSVQPNPDSEFSAILYRKDRFERLEGSTFWLSETPWVAGSKGWDAAFPRIVTWAKFRDLKSGKTFFCFNTHFDHMGEQAREESAKLLLQKMNEIAGKEPVILSGDFNSTDTSKPYLLLTDPHSTYSMTDALFVSKTPHHGPLGSFSGSFTLPGVGNYRIDFIFFRNNITVLKHAILSDSWDGRLPSDHLPVLAEMRID
jgi:endonuclease/exonuclease/phosphatase family metal-dependent hydrolase